MPFRTRRLLVLLLPLLAAAPVRADRVATSYLESIGGQALSQKGVPVATACAGGEIHDDGTVENGYGYASTVALGQLVERFTPATYPYPYQQLCVCWLRLPQSVDDTVSFEVVAYDDDGTGGSPGTLLGSLAATATGVPTTLPGAFTSVDISSLLLSVPAGSVYLGVRWNPSVDQNFFVCADETATTPIAGGYGVINADPWFATQSVFSGYRALMIRAVGPDLIEVPTLDRVGLAALLALLALAALALLRRHTA